MENLRKETHSKDSKKLSRIASGISSIMVPFDKGDMIWHAEILPAATRRALDFFSKESWLKRSRWYLAGGTALALQAGHRASVDLDFFTQKTDFNAGKLTSRFPAERWITDIVKEGTVYGRLNDAKVSFVAYPFFLPRQSMHGYGAVHVLDPRDIAVMKIIAVSQRGRKRDFIDLYWYCKNREPLVAVLRRVSDQYATVTHDFHHIIKSLAYFDDANADPMPKIFFDATWTGIKRFFAKETVAAARELLGIR
jgi:hypothetical protein